MSNDQMSAPSKVTTAICAVMKDVKTLTKSEKNKHGDYDFASIDDFLEATRPLCAKHGLIILPDEIESDIKEGTDKYGKPKRWLFMRYEFTLMHSEGEILPIKPKRSIMVDAAMGAQGFGAGQSYVVKQFMRALLQIATGETDADIYKQEDSISTREDGPAEPVVGTLTKSKLQQQLREFDHQMNTCDDLGEFEGLVYSYDAILKQAERDLPSWMRTKQGSDTLGILDRISAKRDELTAALNGEVKDELPF